jgi:DUF4097 and DUF4098 domain-containing protein YvlB
MTNLNGSERKPNRGYRTLLLLLVALAALSSATRDLNRLQELASGLQEIASIWTDTGVLAVSAAGVSAEESFCREAMSQVSNSSEEFRWSGHVAPGKTIEIKGISGDIEATAGVGEVEVVATKHSRRSDVSSVNIKVVEHSGGVTICAVYPTDDPNQTTSCEPGGRSVSDQNSSAKFNMKSNDVNVDFKVKVPAGVDLLARTVNGQINVSSLSSNVVTHTVNGSIKISTSGYAQAKTVNGEIYARLGDANWTGSLQFKTVNGAINLDLPASTNASVEASTFNGDISSDFAVTVLGKYGRKKLAGTIGAGGRELFLKTLNGSINLRRAGL